MSTPVSLPVYRLPNGLEIYHHRQYETDFVYREVFVEQIYTKPFLHALQRLPTPPCIIDAGANIGLFCLLIKELFPQARLYAFEPSPLHISLLQQNLKSFPEVHIFQRGLGDTNSRQLFTYYPDYSLLSSFYGNPAGDRSLLEAGIATLLQTDKRTSKEDTQRYLPFLTENKLDGAEQIWCETTRLSSVIAEQDIQKIDLLKIDAEKSELPILLGIDPADWGKIHRIVVEAHGIEIYHQVHSLLESKGFQLTSYKSADFNNISIFNIYAQKKNTP